MSEIMSSISGVLWLQPADHKVMWQTAYSQGAAGPKDAQRKRDEGHRTLRYMTVSEIHPDRRWPSPRLHVPSPGHPPQTPAVVWFPRKTKWWDVDRCILSYCHTDTQPGSVNRYPGPSSSRHPLAAEDTHIRDTLLMQHVIWKVTSPFTLNTCSGKVNGFSSNLEVEWKFKLAEIIQQQYTVNKWMYLVKLYHWLSRCVCKPWLETCETVPPVWCEWVQRCGRWTQCWWTRRWRSSACRETTWSDWFLLECLLIRMFWLAGEK